MSDGVVVTVTKDGVPIFVGSPTHDSQLSIEREVGQPAWLWCQIPDLSGSVQEQASTEDGQRVPRTKTQRRSTR